MAEIRLLTKNWETGGLAVYIPDISFLKNLDWIEFGKIFRDKNHLDEVSYYEIGAGYIDSIGNIVFSIQLVTSPEPVKEKRNIHWRLYLSDDYKIMTLTSVDLPAMNEGGKPSDPETMLTWEEASKANRLLNTMTHPVFTKHTDKNLLNKRLREFEEQLTRMAKEK